MSVNLKILREVKVQARLSHQNVVRYYSCWLEHDNDRQELALFIQSRIVSRKEIIGKTDRLNYILVELCGHTLWEYFSQRAGFPLILKQLSSGATCFVDPSLCVSVLVDVCQGLSYIHSQGCSKFNRN